jgi:polyhydroxybutyrate depolymerase
MLSCRFETTSAARGSHLLVAALLLASCDDGVHQPADPGSEQLDSSSLGPDAAPGGGQAEGATGATGGPTSGTGAGAAGGTSGGGPMGGQTADASTPRADGGAPSARGGSAGCGKTGSPRSGMYNLDVGGTQRMYILKLPADYDPSKPYKLIFTWHYLGGSAATIARNYYGLEALAGGTAIFVSPEGIDAGWANTGGRDVAFARAMVDKFKGDYCIDQGRIFSTGFSYGGIMSNTVGCAMGDVFRAIAPMSGMGPRGGRCVGQVAAWLFHGSTDATVQFSAGQASRDHWQMTNHCANEAEPPDANGCIAYRGCDQGFPVIWCETTGGHSPPRFSAAAIWQFFSQF